MISEIENLEKGIVVSTIEYDANKRIIGIGTPTITPNPATGIAPLSKQTAFIPEEKESLAQVAEKVLGANPNQTVSIQEPMSGQPASAIPTPIVNESIVSPTVDVEIPNNLGDLSTVNEVSEPIKNSITEMAKSIPNPVEPKAKTPEVVVPVTEPIATPQEVLATEPTGVNEKLFASAPVQNTVSVIEPIKTEQNIPTNTNIMPEQPVPAPLSFEPRVEAKQETINNNIESSIKPITNNNETSTMELEQSNPNTELAPISMSETEKQEMAKKLASIVTSVISNKITEIAYNASYEEFMELLNEMSNNKKTVQNEAQNISNEDMKQTLVNPILEQEPVQTMKLAA